MLQACKKKPVQEKRGVFSEIINALKENKAVKVSNLSYSPYNIKHINFKEMKECDDMSRNISKIFTVRIMTGDTLAGPASYAYHCTKCNGNACRHVSVMRHLNGKVQNNRKIIKSFLFNKFAELKENYKGMAGERIMDSKESGWLVAKDRKQGPNPMSLALIFFEMVIAVYIKNKSKNPQLRDFFKQFQTFLPNHADSTAPDSQVRIKEKEQFMSIVDAELQFKSSYDGAFSYFRLFLMCYLITEYNKYIEKHPQFLNDFFDFLSPASNNIWISRGEIQSSVHIEWAIARGNEEKLLSFVNALPVPIDELIRPLRIASKWIAQIEKEEAVLLNMCFYGSWEHDSVYYFDEVEKLLKQIMYIDVIWEKIGKQILGEKEFYKVAMFLASKEVSVHAPGLGL